MVRYLLDEYTSVTCEFSFHHTGEVAENFSWVIFDGGLASSIIQNPYNKIWFDMKVTITRPMFHL